MRQCVPSRLRTIEYSRVSLEDAAERSPLRLGRLSSRTTRRWRNCVTSSRGSWQSTMILRHPGTSYSRYTPLVRYTPLLCFILPGFGLVARSRSRSSTVLGVGLGARRLRLSDAIKLTSRGSRCMEYFCSLNFVIYKSAPYPRCMYIRTFIPQQ